jgi:hypothetical protein
MILGFSDGRIVAVFPKKIGTKLFIFHTKKKYRFILLYLVLALKSISGVNGLFGNKKIRPKTEDPFLTTLNNIFIQKLSNYHISLWRKVFFFILNKKNSIHIKVAYCCEGSPKTIRTRSLIGNMVFGGFPKKN